MIEFWKHIVKSKMLKPSIYSPNCSFVQARPMMTPVRKLVALAIVWSMSVMIPFLTIALRNKAIPSVKPKIFGPLTLLGFSVVDSFLLQSSTVRIAPGSCRPMIHVP